MPLTTVIIIGGGVIGTLTARELAKYECKVILLEKESDVSAGTSKANSGIVHAGFDAVPGTQKARFNVAGSLLMERVCKELNVHYKQNGSMVLAFNREQEYAQKELYEQGIQNGVKELYLISPDEARAIEPELSDKVTGVLLAKTGGIVCPYTLTSNAAENAAENGVEIYRSCEVTGITKEADSFIVTTSRGEFKGKYIINAAGVHADYIAELAGDTTFTIYPRRGEYMLFDRTMGGLVSHTIFQMPKKGFGKGILITPTVDGNLLVGPNAVNLSRDEKDAVQTTAEGQAEVLARAKESIPSLTIRGLITSFAGLRAISNNDDFIIKESDCVKNLIHAAGMQSPGLSASPAIAEYIAKLTADLEGLVQKTNFNPCIKEKQPRGAIICRCETISEGEIKDAIHCACGALDIDGVKRRTRAGMGRCQGGFCMPRVLDIIAKETGTDYTQVTKNGSDSAILTDRR